MSSNSEITGSLGLSASPGDTRSYQMACPAPGAMALKDQFDDAADSATGTGNNESRRHDEDLDSEDGSKAPSATSSVYDRRRAARQMALKLAVDKQQELKEKELC